MLPPPFAPIYAHHLRIAQRRLHRPVGFGDLGELQLGQVWVRPVRRRLEGQPVRGRSAERAVRDFARLLEELPEDYRTVFLRDFARLPNMRSGGPSEQNDAYPPSPLASGRKPHYQAYRSDVITFRFANHSGGDAICRHKRVFQDL